MSWKTWTVVAALIAVVFAIYTWAAPEPSPQQPAPAADRAVSGDADDARPARGTVRRTAEAARTPGVDPVRWDWLEAQSGSYKSERNLFAFPAPPPPPPPPQPPPPPDRDKDGIPDFRDNCPDKANPDQTDIDHNGIGAACQAGEEIAPPPPPPPKPVPPPFDYKYIGTFGSPQNPIATFTREGEIVNARIGDTIAGKFVLRSIGIESVEIGFVGFPADEKQRVPIGQ